jgi:ElaB/YqjD/DUF883 family membrane-anchored ribosome-binding protein
MDKTNLNGETRSQMIDDLKQVADNAEELLRTTGQQVGARYQTARSKFESTLSNARDELSSLEERVMDGTRDAIDTADRYVHQNPWQAVGAGALAGLLIGLLLGRR